MTTTAKKASEVSDTPKLSLRILFKGLGMVAVIGAYFIECAFGILFLKNEFRRRSFQIFAIARGSRRLSRVLGIQVSFEGAVPVGHWKNRPASYVVSNHVSFIDIIALARVWPAAFVTSIEVKLSGPLGWISQAGGCLFVERRNRARLEEEKNEIADVLKQGYSVFVFPESTSTDATTVIPFKAALFDCPILAGCPVQPISFRYTRINGVRPDPVLLDHVLYHGDHQFIPQILKVLSLKSIEAVAYFHPPIAVGSSPGEYPADGTGRKLLASQTHSLILDRYARLGGT